MFPKIARSRDETAAEMMLPEAVHHDAGRQWIGGVDDGLGELEAAAALGKSGA